MEAREGTFKFILLNIIMQPLSGEATWGYSSVARAWRGKALM